MGLVLLDTTAAKSAEENQHENQDRFSRTDRWDRFLKEIILDLSAAKSEVRSVKGRFKNKEAINKIEKLLGKSYSKMEGFKFYMNNVMEDKNQRDKYIINLIVIQGLLEDLGEYVDQGSFLSRISGAGKLASGIVSVFSAVFIVSGGILNAFGLPNNLIALGYALINAAPPKIASDR